jgi:dolichol-phosphate mannosyltransferase
MIFINIHIDSQVIKYNNDSQLIRKDLMHVSVVLPTYNERENILLLINEIKQQLSDESEIIVVDDNSPDNTAKAVKELNDPCVRLILRTDERGLTSAIQRGVQEAKREAIIWMDCDFSHPPQKIGELVAKLESGHDVAVASRYVAGGGDYRAQSRQPVIILQVLLSYILRVFTTFMLRLPFSDWSSGYIAIRKSAVVQLLPLRGDYGEYFIVLIASAFKHKLSVIEIPYKNYNRIRGESKTATNVWGLIKRGRKYIKTVLEVRFNEV